MNAEFSPTNETEQGPVEAVRLKLQEEDLGSNLTKIEQEPTEETRPIPYQEDIYSDLDEIKQDPVDVTRLNPNEENIYFNLDLTLPPFTPAEKYKSILKKDKNKETGTLQEVPTLTEENELSNKRTLEEKKPSRPPRHVHFAQVELHEKTHLPYCRRRQTTPTYPGVLHAKFCKNRKYETLEVLGAPTWMNRMFVIRVYNKTAKIMATPAGIKARYVN